MINGNPYYFSEDTISENRILVWMTVLSVACHLILLTGIIFTPKLRPRKHFMPPAVTVDLVALPSSKPQGVPIPKAAQEQPLARVLPEQQIPDKTAPEPEAQSKEKTNMVVRKKVDLSKKPLRVKKSLKKETYKQKKGVKSAIEQIKKQLPQSRSRQVVAAIDKLKEQVETQEGVIKGAAGKTEGLQLIDIYNAEIWHRIQKQWAFPDQLAKANPDLEAVIIVKIMKNGEIRDVWFEERSGNSFLDDSALRAIKKSDPLPPLPQGYTNPYYEVGFRFNPSELQKNATNVDQ